MGSQQNIRGKVSLTRLSGNDDFLLTIFPAESPSIQPITDIERLSRVAAQLMEKTETNVNQLSKLVLQTIRQEFPDTTCGLYLTSRNRGELRFVTSLSPKSIDWIYRPRLNATSVVHLATARGEVQYETRMLTKRESDPARGMVSELAHPLAIGDTPIGVLHLQRKGTTEYTASEIRILGFIAERVAVALERTRLFEEAERRGREFEAVVEISSLLRGTKTRSEMAQLILAQISRFLEADGATLAITAGVGAEPLYIKHGHGGIQAVPGLSGPLNADVTRQLAGTQKLSSETGQLTNPDAPQLEALAAVPLISEGKAIGTLWAGRKQPF